MICYVAPEERAILLARVASQSIRFLNDLSSLSYTLYLNFCTVNSILKDEIAQMHAFSQVCSPFWSLSPESRHQSERNAWFRCHSSILPLRISLSLNDLRTYNTNEQPYFTRRRSPRNSMRRRKRKRDLESGNNIFSESKDSR